jgi:selenide,water dikinase
MQNTIRLTQYSKGAGCGCKIAPNVLEEILKGVKENTTYKNLIIGNESGDDAAVFDLGNGTALISTTDFFMPIVDDPFDFGRIASANAISDVYAMGGEPLMAIAILGWPVEKISTALAQKVLEGARAVCAEAGIPLAGGHSIDSAEPIFGLSVSGLIKPNEIKKNNTAKPGDYLLLTKPIGVGILSTAQKREVIAEAHQQQMIASMTKLNKTGSMLGKMNGVTSMTDVTGFGLLGHCIEMATGSGNSIELFYSKIPVIDGAKEYLAQRVVPDATYRNWNSYSNQTTFEKGVNVMEAFNLLPDPQTNGGLLISVDPESLKEVQGLLVQNGLSDFTEPIGVFGPPREKKIMVLA